MKETELEREQKRKQNQEARSSIAVLTPLLEVYLLPQTPGTDDTNATYKYDLTEDNIKLLNEKITYFLNQLK